MAPEYFGYCIYIQLLSKSPPRIAILYAYGISGEDWKRPAMPGLHADTLAYVSADIRLDRGSVIRHMALQKVVST